MHNNLYNRPNRPDKRRRLIRSLQYVLIAVLVVILAGLLFYIGKTLIRDFSSKDNKTETSATSSEGTQAPITTEAETTEDNSLAELLTEAQALADEYDYDAAIALLQSDTAHASSQEATDAVSGYETAKSQLVRVDPQTVTHVFFHSLIMDTSLAFNGNTNQDGYNQMMTTESEFLKIMQSMYDRGYVLVKIRDLAYEAADENGNPKFTYGDIMLPEGKKAFILSQDDVCFYEYMDGQGFASKIIIGEDGYPTCEYKNADGTTSVGAYDLVPILEDFVQSHPGFSYKGARGILAFTGYNGILGYRTDASYKDTNPNYEADREEAAKVAQCLRDHGWELASHSWGHRNLGQISMEHLKTDSQKWKDNVESLTGPVDIILYPFGADIGDWHPYSDSNERFTYLKSMGFRYFCNVDASKPAWMQIGNDSFRQARRNLDGYRMYHNPDSLSDLFDVSEVFDQARPTPVPNM